MRLVLVVSQFPSLSETFIVSKFLGLLDQGIDVHIVCSTNSPSLWVKFPQLERRDVRWRVHINWPVAPRVRAMFLMPFVLFLCLITTPRSTVRYINRGYRRFGIDVFRRLYLDAALVRLRPRLIHFEFGAIAAQRMYLKTFLDCKITVSFRGYDINYVGLDRPNYYADVWREADGFHFLGQDLRNRALQRGCPTDTPFTLIPPAIKVEQFMPAASGTAPRPSNRPLRILSVGRLEWKKGYDFALQAMKQFSEHYDGDFEYQIIGDGDLYEALHFCRYQLGLTTSVTFEGALPHSRVAEALQDADILLHAAVSEGFCNAVIEAQAMHLPCVVTDADGLRENIEDGVTGFVVPRRDPEAMATKLLQLANDPALRTQMGHAGRERVKQFFRLEDQLEAFEYFYRVALARTNDVS